MRKSFKAGDVIFQEGDASAEVLRVLQGTLEIVREVGSDRILLGTVGPGEFVGEMGVIQGRPRSATALAASAVRVEVMPRNTFLSHVTRDPDVAQELILRLSTRLRDVDDRLAEALGGAATPDGDGKPAQVKSPAKLPKIAIAAVSAHLKERIGDDPILIETLPFRVGRPADNAEPTSIIQPDLLVNDREPHRLSRQHFEVFADDAKICVRDLHSTLGTSVNGQPIGHHFATDRAELTAGSNQVAAGGRDTPYEFAITIS